MNLNIKSSSKKDKRLLFETIFIIAITIVLFIAFNNLSSIISTLPAVYFIIERRIRNRSWKAIGFKWNHTLLDIKKNWFWILLVGVVLPLLIFIISKYYMPEFISHVKERLPMDISIIILVIVTITIGTFLEEIIFRGFIQERLSWYIGIPFAIFITSFLFAFMHYSQGSFNIVAFDMVGIIVDSIIYGVIFARTKNIFASWIGHYLSDLVAITCILFFF